MGIACSLPSVTVAPPAADMTEGRMGQEWGEKGAVGPTGGERGQTRRKLDKQSNTSECVCECSCARLPAVPRALSALLLLALRVFVFAPL
jgi:hypothetical protein